MVSSARPEEMEFPTWRRAPDDGLIAAVRQHAHTRRSSVGVCDSEVMFVASCRLIQGAIRVKVHRIDVHMRQRPVSLSFPPLFPFFSRRVTIDRVAAPRFTHFSRDFPQFFPSSTRRKGGSFPDFSKTCAILEKDRQQKQNIQRNNDSSRFYNI